MILTVKIEGKTSTITDAISYHWFPDVGELNIYGKDYTLVGQGVKLGAIHSQMDKGNQAEQVRDLIKTSFVSYNDVYVTMQDGSQLLMLHSADRAAGALQFKRIKNARGQFTDEV